MNSTAFVSNPEEASTFEKRSSNFTKESESAAFVKTEDLLNDIRMNAQRPNVLKPIKLQLGGSLGQKSGPDGSLESDRALFISHITKFLPIVPQDINAGWMLPWLEEIQVGRESVNPSQMTDFITRV
uniref:Uncharacterized protein n=1 Tax=Cacopsylla melanoneura TaxID=428564 RepID=A0A8D8ZER3_9HEMI